MSKILQRHRTKLHKTKKGAPTDSRKSQTDNGTVQLYCAVQPRSPNHRQTTTEEVQSSVRDGTSSATVHS